MRNIVHVVTWFDPVSCSVCFRDYPFKYLSKAAILAKSYPLLSAMLYKLKVVGLSIVVNYPSWMFHSAPIYLVNHALEHPDHSERHSFAVSLHLENNPSFDTSCQSALPHNFPN